MHAFIITALVVIPVFGVYLVWDTMPTRDEEDDL
jgi:hypothetical protein